MTKLLTRFFKNLPQPLKDGIKDTLTRAEPPLRRARQRAEAAAALPAQEARVLRFLAGRGRLAVPRVDAPEVSVVVVARGGAGALLATLRSVLDSTVAVELVLVDLAASRRVRRLLGRVDGATVVRVEGRPDPLQAERQAVERARGKFVALLDPDGRLDPGSLEAALETIRSRPDVGAVGGRTIRASGRLEGAGGILWRDGSTSAYGAGRAPQDPEFLFARAVDFTSAGFLLTARDAFEAHLARAAFDEARVTEAGDGRLLDRIAYGAALRAAGRETVYDPRIVVRRAGRVPGLAPTRASAAVAPALVVARLGAQLGEQFPRSGNHELLARQRTAGRHRVLYIDDRIPHFSLGMGLPRTRRIVAELVDLGCLVTYYPLYPLSRLEKWPDVRECLDRRVEVMTNRSHRDIGQFLEEREGAYDVILISRPTNMELVRPFLAKALAAGRPRVIYDAEALFTPRTIERLRMLGEEPSPEQQRAMMATEVGLVAGCAAVLSVSAKDAADFRAHGTTEVYTLAHSVEAAPTPAPFEARAGFLFVGPVNTSDTPNADSIAWFVGDILPRLRAALGGPAQFRVVGKLYTPEFAEAHAADGVTFLGAVPDLAPLYDSARVFVAPARFAAGIPLKCVEAAAAGVPIVMTPLLAEQLGWEDGVEALVADGAEVFAAQCARLHEDRELWTRIRANALQRVERSFSAESFKATLRQALGDRPGSAGRDDRPSPLANLQPPVGV